MIPSTFIPQPSPLPSRRGEHVKVLGPAELKKRVTTRLKAALA